MTQEVKNKIADSVRSFKMPLYQEIPNVGLYLEQVTKYVSEYLSPLTGITITGSMISNYVKKKLISNPVKKAYNRDQIASVLFIAIAKSVLSLEDIQKLLHVEKEYTDPQTAYTCFCRDLEACIASVFGINESGNIAKEIPAAKSDEEQLLRKLNLTIANKIYLETYFKLN